MTVNTTPAVISLDRISVSGAYNYVRNNAMGLTDEWRTLYLLFKICIREINNTSVLEYDSD